MIIDFLEIVVLRFSAKLGKAQTGLISTKRPELEEHDAIKARYEQAKAVVGDNIALSPQCGFASVEEGNCIDEETQWKKIDLLVSCQDFI